MITDVCGTVPPGEVTVSTPLLNSIPEKAWENLYVISNAPGSDHDKKEVRVEKATGNGYAKIVFEGRFCDAHSDSLRLIAARIHDNCVVVNHANSERVYGKYYRNIREGVAEIEIPAGAVYIYKQVQVNEMYKAF